MTLFLIKFIIKLLNVRAKKKKITKTSQTENHFNFTEISTVYVDFSSAK